ncbi:MAG: lysophospholipase [Acidobacteriia bacterium]|nr:lysophospholipase [Terriglobia bacterium]
MKLGNCFFPLLLSGALLAADSVSLDTGTGVLYGTLELPAAKSPYPIALIIAGSGPTDRDGNSLVIKGKNDSLKLLAEGLAARGIASLRYDKRGFAQMKTGAFKEAEEAGLRFDMYVDDAVRWGQYLRTDSRFGALVVAGHSEGSLIGMIAAHKLAANGYVSIAGAGQPGGQIILKQLRAQKIPADHMKQLEDIVKALEEGHTPESVPAGLEFLFRPSIQPYLISWFKYDPAREIARLTMPTLILQGSTDIQVAVSDAKLLKAANPSARLVVVEGMNHVLKEVPAGQKDPLASYSDPSLPVAPQLLDEMAALIRTAAEPGPTQARNAQ